MNRGLRIARIAGIDVVLDWSLLLIFMYHNQFERRRISCLAPGVVNGIELGDRAGRGCDVFCLRAGP